MTTATLPDAAPTPLPLLPPAEQARRQLSVFFEHGFEVGEFIEIRCLHCHGDRTRPGPRAYFRSVADAVDFAMQQRDACDVFFGVGLRRCPAVNHIDQCPHKERGRDHVSRLSAVWGDFDVANENETAADIAARLRGGGNVPKMLVQSGKGLHAYWDLDPTSDLDGIERTNRAIRDGLGADNAVDAPRILRVAGTFNYKYDEPLPVLLLTAPS